MKIVAGECDTSSL